MGEKFFLGIDGGGTKTEAVIIDEHERVRGAGLGGESNYTFVGAEVAAESFRTAIEAALTEASISGKEIIAAGCTFGAPAMMVFKGLGIEVRPAGVSEARVAFERAGIEVLRGVSLIAGTGCSCFARGDDGRRAHAGGWGALLGDDGSAYDIGRRGIREGILAEEGHWFFATVDQSGVFLVCFALGWFLITLLTGLFTRTQWWALIPGGIMAVIGGSILVTNGTLRWQDLNLVYAILLLFIGLFLIAYKGRPKKIE